MTDAFVAFDGVTVGHRKTPVLSGVSATIGRGELVGLLGVSGSGKSTLLAAVAGADVVLDGSLTVGGQDPCRRRGVGLVPQASDEHWGPLCVEEIVALGLPRSGWRVSRAERTAAKEKLEALGLAGLGRRRVEELSGGQRQRVAIARALTASADLILCDEPTSGADPSLASEIVDVLSEVAAQGTTVIVATHDLGTVVPRLHRLLGIAGGGLVLDVDASAMNGADLAAVYGPTLTRSR